MSENQTASMLQRVPVILAVTAASYGLSTDGGTRDKPAVRGKQGRDNNKAQGMAQARDATPR